MIIISDGLWWAITVFFICLIVFLIALLVHDLRVLRGCFSQRRRKHN